MSAIANYFALNSKFIIFSLLSLDVVSLEDVYWLEDSKAGKALGKDVEIWSKVRQKLPTSKPLLEQLKADLWSTIVKSSEHQDAVQWVIRNFLIFRQLANQYRGAKNPRKIY